jgi:hypothetical protein
MRRYSSYHTHQELERERDHEHEHERRGRSNRGVGEERNKELEKRPSIGDTLLLICDIVFGAISGRRR